MFTVKLANDAAANAMIASLKAGGWVFLPDGTTEINGTYVMSMQKHT